VQGPDNLNMGKTGGLLKQRIALRIQVKNVRQKLVAAKKSGMKMLRGGGGVEKKLGDDGEASPDREAPWDIPGD